MIIVVIVVDVAPLITIDDVVGDISMFVVGVAKLTMVDDVVGGDDDDDDMFNDVDVVVVDVNNHDIVDKFTGVAVFIVSVFAPKQFNTKNTKTNIFFADL